MTFQVTAQTEPHVCDNDSLRVVVQRTRTKPSKISRVMGICQDPGCRRVWNRSVDQKTWYDPNEGPDPFASVDDGDADNVSHELAETLAASGTVAVATQIPFCPCPNSYMERTGRHMPGCKVPVMRAAQKAQLDRANALVEGFEGQARIVIRQGERQDEVWVHVDGQDEPIRLTPGRRGVTGAVLLPKWAEPLAQAIDLDMRSI